MVGYKEEVKVCTINQQGLLDVHTYYDESLVEKDMHVEISNVCYPFRFYKAIQECTKSEYESMIEGL